MAIAYAKRALQNLTTFKSTKWYKKDFVTMALRIATDYASRNEINYGLADLAKGSSWATNKLDASGSAGEVVINGVIKVLPALSNTDLLAVAGNVLGAITPTGGEFAEVIDYSAQEYYVTLLATNSDGDGTQTDTDGSNAKYVCIVDTASFTSSVQIAAAIAATGSNTANWDHEGCKYVIVAQITLEENDASSSAIALNRNNVLGQ